MGRIFTWFLVAVTIGAVVGLAHGFEIASENSYFRADLRNLAGLVLQSNILAGARWGLVGAALGLAAAVLAWPGSWLVFRTPANATRAAIVAVPVLALYALVGYKINVDYLPGFLSVTSLSLNALLTACFVMLWWLTARVFVKYQQKTRVRHFPSFLPAASLLLLTVVVGGSSAFRYMSRANAPETSPNIIFVLIDTLRADRLGTYGYHRDTSPNIDRLARDSWVFTGGIAQASWTKPSMASIFTGVYVHQTSVRPGSWAQAGTDGAITVNTLAPEHLTSTELLAAAGYRTGGFGNNHHLLPSLGFSQGFETYDWAQAQTIRLGPFRQLRKALPRSWSDWMGDPEFWTDWINEHFLEWLEGKENERFFAYLHHIDVHWPYRSPPPFAGMFSDQQSPVDFNAPGFMNETVAELRGGKAGNLDPRIVGAMSDAYDEGIRYVDDRLGKLFDELKKRGLYDNTLIIITADHGEEFLEHGLLGHGESLYDEVIRVPLIVKFPCPGSYCGHRKIESQVELVDIFPTIMALAGVRPPAALVGRSLLDPIEQGRNAFSEWDQSISLRTPQWKLIYDLQNDSGELYNLGEDPAETLDHFATESELGSILMARLLDFTTTHQSLAAADSGSVEADKRMLENLRALGYVK